MTLAYVGVGGESPRSIDIELPGEYYFVDWTHGEAFQLANGEVANAVKFPPGGKMEDGSPLANSA